MRNLLFLAWALLACASLGAGKVSAQAAPAVSFAHTDTLRLTGEHLRTGAAVLLRNTGPRARTLRVTVVDVDERRSLRSLLSVQAKTLTVGPGTGPAQGEGAFRLVGVRGASSVAPGRYPGAVEVRDVNGRLLLRRPVDMSVAGPEPMDTAWHANIYKLAPAVEWRARRFTKGELRCARGGATNGACVRDNVLPLRIPSSNTSTVALGSPGRMPQLYAGEQLGILKHTKEDDRAVVSWTGGWLRSGGELEGMVLKFASFDVPGDYTGTIRLGSVADTAVTMTVRVTHDWPLAFGLLALGVLLSGLLQRYLRSSGSILSAKSDLPRLFHRIALVDGRLKAADSRDPGSLPFQVDEDLKSAIHKRDQDLRRSTRLRRAAEAEVAAVKSELPKWEAEIREWERFAEALGRLHGDLARARDRATALDPTGSAPLPLLLRRAGRRLAGTALSSEHVAGERQAVEEEARLVRKWEEVAEAVEAGLGAGAPNAGQAAEKLRTALDSGGLDEVCDLLDPAAGGGPRFRSDSYGGSGVVKQDGGSLAVEAAVSAEAQAPAAVGESLLVPGVVGEAELRRRIRSAERWERGIAWTYQILTGLVIAITGLTEMYYGKPVFGTPSDYLGVFLWGFGGKLGMDAVRAVITQGELPWPKWAKRPASTEPAQQTPASG